MATDPYLVTDPEAAALEALLAEHPGARVERARSSKLRARKGQAVRVWVGNDLLAASCTEDGHVGARLTPVLELARHTKGAGGRQLLCRRCDAERSRRNRSTPEGLAASRETVRRWRQANREATREAVRAKREANPEATRAADREAKRRWRAANPEAAREAGRRAYAAKLAARPASTPPDSTTPG